jgi:hypothetical protein
MNDSRKVVNEEPSPLLIRVGASLPEWVDVAIVIAFANWQLSQACTPRRRACGTSNDRARATLGRLLNARLPPLRPRLPHEEI